MTVSERERKDLEYKKGLPRLAEERIYLVDGKDGHALPEYCITEQGKSDHKKKDTVLYQ